MPTPEETLPVNDEPNPSSAKEGIKKGHRLSTLLNPEEPRNPLPRAGITPLEGEPSNKEQNIKEKMVPMKSEKKVKANES